MAYESMSKKEYNIDRGGSDEEMVVSINGGVYNKEVPRVLPPPPRSIGRLLMLLVCFVAIVCVWGVVDTVVAVISNDNHALKSIVYICITLACMAVIKIYQLLVDSAYDPVRDLTGAP